MGAFTIGRKLALLIVGVSVLFAAVSAAMQLHAEHRAGRRALDETARAIEGSYLGPIALAVWALDRTQIDSQLAGIRRLPYVAGAEVRGPLPWASTAAAADGDTRMQRHVFTLYKPADAPERVPQVLGELHVALSLAAIDAQLRGLLAGIVATELLRAAVLAAILYLGVSALITRRLGALARRMAQVEFERLPRGAAVDAAATRRPDEIHALARSINEMLAKLGDEIEARERLAVAKQVAELSNEAKSLFLANMSHEIRTPMNAVIGMSQLALDGQMDERTRHYVERVRSSADLLLAIINEILDFSKIEAGKLEVEALRFDLHDLLESLCDVVEFSADRKGLAFDVDVSPDVPRHVVGDALRLRQILLNLTSNAVKFTARGRVRLALPAPARDADGRVRLRFAVGDTGIGIAADKLGHIFTPFQQADSSTTRNFGGTGLGLSISQRLAGLMGGSIEVESVPGVGSCFTLVLALPVDDAAAAPALPAGPALSVRVVDDDPLGGRLTQALCAAMGLAPESEVLPALPAAGGAPLPRVELALVDGALLAGTRARGDALAPLRAAAGRIVALTRPSDDFGGALERELTDVVFVERPLLPSRLQRLLDLLAGRNAAPGPTLQSPLHAGPSGLRGLQVLLVEDNEINVELAVDLLQRAGIDVTVARDGQQALEQLPACRPDLVLMDCQMPVCDGYEATRRIRRLPEFARLPIIAMTAGAVQGDRTRALEAGMDDYITKPIEFQRLYDCIRQWAEAIGVRGRDAPAAARATPGLDVAGGVGRAFGNAALYQRLLRLFVGQHAAGTAAIADCVRRRDRDGAARLAHVLRGAALALCIEAVAERSQVFEQAVVDGAGFDVLERLAARLDEALQQALDDIRRFMAAAAEAQATAVAA